MPKYYVEEHQLGYQQIKAEGKTSWDELHGHCGFDDFAMRPILEKTLPLMSFAFGNHVHWNMDAVQAQVLATLQPEVSKWMGSTFLPSPSKWRRKSRHSVIWISTTRLQTYVNYP